MLLLFSNHINRLSSTNTHQLLESDCSVPVMCQLFQTNTRHQLTHRLPHFYYMAPTHTATASHWPPTVHIYRRRHIPGTHFEPAVRHQLAHIYCCTSGHGTECRTTIHTNHSRGQLALALNWPSDTNCSHRIPFTRAAYGKWQAPTYAHQLSHIDF